MRTSLGALIAAGALLIGAPAASAADPNVKVGAGGKLANENHAVTLAAKVKCEGNATMKVVAKVKQGSTLGRGVKTIACKRGKAQTFTIDAANADAVFAPGAAEACVAATKKASDRAPKFTCRQITVAAP